MRPGLIRSAGIHDGYKVDKDEFGNDRVTYHDYMAVGFAGDVKMESIIMSVTFPALPATDSLIAQLSD